mmetsp:Transcript_6792/g.15708  ORF Transcript_6792/g.15708 Transcript_6792/m.15708 type:complete len:245 (+) Transcript_6792:1110-1844(+)
MGRTNRLQKGDQGLGGAASTALVKHLRWVERCNESLYPTPQHVVGKLAQRHDSRDRVHDRHAVLADGIGGAFVSPLRIAAVERNLLDRDQRPGRGAAALLDEGRVVEVAERPRSLGHHAADLAVDDAGLLALGPLLPLLERVGRLGLLDPRDAVAAFDEHRDVLAVGGLREAGVPVLPLHVHHAQVGDADVRVVVEHLVELPGLEEQDRVGVLALDLPPLLLRRGGGLAVDPFELGPIDVERPR